MTVGGGKVLSRNALRSFTLGRMKIVLHRRWTLRPVCVEGRWFRRLFQDIVSFLMMWGGEE